MKLKDLLNVCTKSIILLDVPGEESLIDNYDNDLTSFEEREVVNIKAFYQRTGLFKYGLIVEVK